MNVRNDFHFEGPELNRRIPGNRRRRQQETDRSYVKDDRWSGRSCLAAVDQSLRRSSRNLPSHTISRVNLLLLSLFHIHRMFNIHIFEGRCSAQP